MDVGVMDRDWCPQPHEAMLDLVVILCVASLMWTHVSCNTIESLRLDIGEVGTSAIANGQGQILV